LNAANLERLAASLPKLRLYIDVAARERYLSPAVNGENLH